MRSSKNRSQEILCFLAVFLLSAGPVSAEFSLFGVRMGFTQEEVEAQWEQLAEGEYYIKASALSSVQCQFDQAGRLFKMSFSVPLPGDHPQDLTVAAAQEVINQRWGRNPELLLAVRAGRDSIGVTLTSAELQREYKELIKLQLEALLQP